MKNVRLLTPIKNNCIYFLNAKQQQIIAINQAVPKIACSNEIILDTWVVLRHLTAINNSKDNIPNMLKNIQECST